MARKSQKSSSSKSDAIPTGYLEVHPKIIYTPNVTASFDHLENALKRYNIHSQAIFMKQMKKWITFTKTPICDNQYEYR